MNRQHYVHDIETLSNCFTYTGLNIDTEEVVQYVIHKSRNDLTSLIAHLIQVKCGIGFNNNAFDWPILHFIKTNEGLFETIPGEVLAKSIYQRSQDLIASLNSEDKTERYKYSIPEWEQTIPQLDLYKINHFDNQAKRTSLKDLEFWMQYPNVQDMPIKHSEAITASQIPLVLDYNLNDVKATYAFYKLNLGKIELRQQLGEQYDLQLDNANDPKIGSEIFLDLMSKRLNIKKKELRLKRTYRGEIHLKHCILPSIEFKSPTFKSLHSHFLESVVRDTKNALSASIVYKGLMYEYGLGGLHACIKPGVYQSDNQYIIRDLDVSSLYPSICAGNNIYPKHLGKEFSEVYNSLIIQRLDAKREGNKIKSEGLKLALNGSFG